MVESGTVRSRHALGFFGGGFCNHAMMKIAVVGAVFVLFVASARADRGADAAVRAFHDWMTAQGCKLHPSLRLRAIRSRNAQRRSPDKASPTSLRWSVVTAPESEGHVDPVFPEDDILACGAEAILVAPHADLMQNREEAAASRAPALRKLEDLGFRGEDLLALELLAHKTVGSASRFQIVIDTLASGTEVNAM